MVSKELPFTKEKITEIIEQYPTPFHIYDEEAIIKIPGSLRRHSARLMVLRNILL
ncbi:MAG: hypothetical protein R2741_08855 [Methanolobus sp.]